MIFRDFVEMFFNEFDDKKTGDCAEHDPREEKRVTDLFLNPAGDGTGQHHAECHEAGAEGIVGSLVRPGTELYHKEGEGCETEPVAELLDGHAGGDEGDVRRGEEGQVEVDEVGDVHGADHTPEPMRQSLASDGYAAQDAAQGEGKESDSPVEGADLQGG